MWIVVKRVVSKGLKPSKSNHHSIKSFSGRSNNNNNNIRTRGFPEEEKDVKSLIEDAATDPDESLNPDLQAPFLSKTYAIKSKRAHKDLDHDIPREEDHSRNSCILFPGQGSQFVGMGSRLFEANLPAVSSLFERASHILNYDLKKMCLEGPKEELNRTLYCQPAIFVTSLAAVEKLYSENPKYIEDCVSTAGFSVGELTALVFSGTISFVDGLKLVRIRAEEMERCSNQVPSGMMSVFYGADSDLKLGLQVAEKWAKEKHGIEKPVIRIANYLYPGAKVLAGHQQALDFLEENKSEFKIRKTKRVPVSGAFHTSLMQDAVVPFKEALLRTRIKTPRIPVYSNVDHRIYTDAKSVRYKLPSQIVKPVKWEQVMNIMLKYQLDENIPKVFECGPGDSLSGMIRKINGKVSKRTLSVSV